MPNTKPKMRLKFHVSKGKTGHRELCNGEARPKVPSGRFPRISRLMALAIRSEQLIRDGACEIRRNWLGQNLLQRLPVQFVLTACPPPAGLARQDPATKSRIHCSTLQYILASYFEKS